MGLLIKDDIPRREICGTGSQSPGRGGGLGSGGRQELPGCAQAQAGVRIPATDLGPQDGGIQQDLGIICFNSSEVISSGVVAQRHHGGTATSWRGLEFSPFLSGDRVLICALPTGEGTWDESWGPSTVYGVL